MATSNQTLKLQIARVKNTVLNGAMLQFNGRPMANKTEAMEVLADMVINGSITLEMIQAAPETAISATEAVDPAMVQAVGTVASRAESVALDALKHGKDAHVILNDMTTVLKDMQDQLKAVSKQGGKTLDTASIQAQVTKAVADAFKPFNEAVQATGSQAIVASMASVHVIDRKPCLDVFGLDVRDMKGDPMMVDIYNATDAPPVDPHFVWTHGILRHFILSQDTGENTFMGGDKGTGKSQSASQWAARTGRPYVRYNFHKQTTADDYAGAQALEQGSSVFKRGDFLQAYVSPATVILLDEISFSNAGNLATLNGFLEADAVVSYGGMTHRKAQGVMIFGADNTMGNGDETGRYSGTTPMNSATLDRFSRIVPFTFMPLDLETKAVVNRTGCDPRLAEHVLKAINVARAKAKTGDIVEAPSIRSVMAFIRAVKVMTVDEAWSTTVAARQPSESAPVLESIKLSCIDSKLISTLI
jgi:cobaltochelatase CobS